jgi:hypothetical protein
MIIAMPADDPISQAKFLIESDERQRSIGLKFASGILKLCQSIPFLEKQLSGVENPLEAITGTIENWRGDNVAYLLDVLTEEVERLCQRIESLSEAHKAFIEGDWLKLVIDGAAKAQQTRAKSRVTLLARVLAHAFYEGEKESADKTEEMMKVALSIDRDDIVVLSWLCDGVREHYTMDSGQVNHEAVNSFWGQVDQHGGTRWGGEPVPPGRLSKGDLMSACAKLQGLGLVVQVQPNQSKVSPGTLPYGPLKKGYEFLNYVRAES